MIPKKPMRLAATAILIATVMPPGVTAAAETRTTCDHSFSPIRHSALSGHQALDRKPSYQRLADSRRATDSAGQSGPPSRPQGLSADQQLLVGTVRHLLTIERAGFLPVGSRDVRDRSDRRGDSGEGACLSRSIAGTARPSEDDPRTGESKEHDRPSGCLHPRRDGSYIRIR